jgi:hypothetical protein
MIAKKLERARVYTWVQHSRTLTETEPRQTKRLNSQNFHFRK